MLSKVINEIKLKDRQLKCLTNPFVLNLEKQLNDANDAINISYQVALTTGLFLFAYVNQNDNIDLILLDRNGNIVKERRNLITNKTFLEINFLKIIISNDIIYLYTDETNSETFLVMSLIRSFDKNFQELKQIKIKESSHFVSWNEHLYIMNETNGNFKTLTAYNSNLEIVEQFGQANPDLPYFISDFANLILVNDEYFIIGEPIETDKMDQCFTGKITLLNKFNGKNFKSFKLPFYDLYDNFFLYSNKYICAFNKYVCKLSIFTLDCDLFNEIKFDPTNLSKNKEEFTNEIGIYDKQLYFFDSLKLCLYFFEKCEVLDSQ